MDTENDVAQLIDEDTMYALIPADFPRRATSGSVSGAQPKVLLRKYKDRFYSTGTTPPEIYERWNFCEELVEQFVPLSKDSKAGKRAHMSEVDILDQYLARLLATGWTSAAEARWVFRRTAAILRWPVPHSAMESGDEVSL